MSPAVGMGGVDLAQGPRGGALHQLAGVLQKFHEQGRGSRQGETAERFDGGLADEHFVGLRGGFDLAQHAVGRAFPDGIELGQQAIGGRRESDSGGEASQPLARPASG